jgi:hypothetical protein
MQVSPDSHLQGEDEEIGLAQCVIQFLDSHLIYFFYGSILAFKIAMLVCCICFLELFLFLFRVAILCCSNIIRHIHMYTLHDGHRIDRISKLALLERTDFNVAT